MKIARHQISAYFAQQTLAKGINKELMLELAAYLLDQGRTSEIDSIIRDIGEYWSEKGTVNLTTVSAHELNDEVIDDVKKIAKQIYPNAREVVISKKLDPSLIGGGRIELPNRQLDLSVRTKLDHFRQLVGEGRSK